MKHFLRLLGLPNEWPHFSLIELHQAVVHFPIALLVCGVLFELTGALFKKAAWRDTAFRMHLFGTAAALVAIVLGWTGNPFTHGEASLRADIHRWWGVATFVVFAALAMWRLKSRDKFSKSARFFYNALGVLGVLIVLITGYLGSRVAGD